MKLSAIGAIFSFVFVGAVGGDKHTAAINAVEPEDVMLIAWRKNGIEKRQRENGLIVKPNDEEEYEERKKPWMIGVQHLYLQGIR